VLGAHKTWRGLLACAAAGVATWEAQRLLYHLGACRELALVSLVHVPPLKLVLAVLPLVFIGDIAATTLFWLLGFKQSWI
jgi:hypothetical protein